MSNNTRIIIGLVGFISSGKDTAADFLVKNYNFKRESFADPLKDAVSNVFGWDRFMLEGSTEESRQWREQPDEWWSLRLNKPITPRWILQQWGTEVCRGGFHDDIWIASLENRLQKTMDHVVISDVRFPNEIAAIKRAGGTIVRVARGKNPDWYDDAKLANAGDHVIGSAIARARMRKSGIHSSEWAWIGDSIDLEIDNNGTKEGLFEQIKGLVSDLLVAKAI